MISIKTINGKTEAVLNTNTLGITFRLFTDTGRYKRAVRRDNSVIDYANGITSVTSSDISNTNDGIEYGTITLRTEVLVRCRDEEADIMQLEEVVSETGETLTEEQLVELGNENYIQAVRDLLDDVFSKQVTAVIDEDEKSYNVSISYSLALSGVRNQVSYAGDCYTFVFYTYCNVIENGENSKTYSLELDGRRVPYSTLTVRRVPTQEANVYAGGEGKPVSKCINSNTVLGISLECPAFVSLLNDTVKNYLLRGEENTAHFLTLDMNGAEESYLAVFGQADSTAQNVLNAGQTLSFCETVEEYGIISLPPEYYVYVYGGENGTVTAQTEDKALAYNFSSKKFVSGEKSLVLTLEKGGTVASLSEIKNAAQINFTRIQ